MEQELKALSTELQKTVADFRTYVEKEIGEIKAKGHSDPETKESLEKANIRIDELEAMLKRASTMAEDTAHKDGGVRLTENQKAYKNALEAYMRKGRTDGLDDLHQKAMSVASDPDGGYLVTPDSSGRVIERIRDTTPMRQIANVQTISTDALEGPIDRDEASFGWVGEAGTRSETNTPQVGMWRIPTHEMYAMPKATQKLLDDAAVDVGAWLERKIADKLARGANDAYVNGDGVQKPRGFATYTTAATADSSRTWGQLEHIVTGANGDFGTAPGGAQDKLIDLVTALNPGYRNGARWLAPRAVVGKIRKFKEATTNAYIWQPGLTAGQPSTILGYPLTESEDMPALATNSLSLAFGNFQEGYQIVDRIGIRILRDPYTAKPFILFYATARTGGAVVNFDAIKFLKFST
jgi:HK97 family phage major capsid protein